MQTALQTTHLSIGVVRFKTGKMLFCAEELQSTNDSDPDLDWYESNIELSKFFKARRMSTPNLLKSESNPDRSTSTGTSTEISTGTSTGTSSVIGHSVQPCLLEVMDVAVSISGEGQTDWIFKRVWGVKVRFEYQGLSLSVLTQY